jgi:hypothetical protein
MNYGAIHFKPTNSCYSIIEITTGVLTALRARALRPRVGLGSLTSKTGVVRCGSPPPPELSQLRYSFFMINNDTEKIYKIPEVKQIREINKAAFLKD